MLALFSLSELTTPTTVDEARQSIYDVMALAGVTTTNWREGAVTRTVVTGVAVIYAALTVLIAQIAAGGYLQLASGAWKRLVAIYTFGVTPFEATFAVGTVTITNAAGGVFDFDPFELAFSNNATGKTYHNTAAIHIGSNATVSGIPVQADEIGTDSNAAPGDITEFVTVISSNLSVTNPTAVVGQDDESDPDLERRCSDKLGSLSPMGPPDAYGYAARSAVRADGSAIGVNRVRVIPDGSGRVSVYCATAAGAIPGAVEDLSTDLGCVDDSIQRLAAPLAIDALTVSAAVVPVPVTYTAYIYNTAGLTAELAAGYIQTALAALMGDPVRAPIGGNRVVPGSTGYLYRSAVEAAISGAVTGTGKPIPMFQLQMTQPVVDVALSDSAVPTLGAVNGNIVFVTAKGL